MNAPGHKTWLAVALLSALAASPLQADPKGHRDQGGQQSAQEGGISLDEAVDRAQRRYNARVVRAETRVEGGRRVHVLRLLSADSRVWSVRVDAMTGQFQ